MLWNKHPPIGCKHIVYYLQIQSVFIVVVIFIVGGDNSFILNRLPKCFSLASKRVYFSVYLTKCYLSSLRNLETGWIDWVDSSGQRQYQNSEWHLQLLILKVDVRGVRRRPLKSFATPVVPTEEVTFIQSSWWTCLLGRWLMRAWQIWAEGHIVWLVVHKNVWQGEVQTLIAEESSVIIW